MLTHKRLLQILSYDSETGVFVWRYAPNGRVPKGSVVGWAKDSGHLCVKINRSSYLCHRLAWFYVFGEWPALQIDHINGDPKDNRIANLRCVPREMNAQNIRKPTKRNKSGFLGVTACNSKFRASISHDGRVKHIGVFSTPEEAYEAYVTTKRKLHPGCTL